MEALPYSGRPSPLTDEAALGRVCEAHRELASQVEANFVSCLSRAPTCVIRIPGDGLGLRIPGLLGSG